MMAWGLQKMPQNLGYADDDWNTKCKSYRKVLLGHANDTSISSDD